MKRLLAIFFMLFLTACDENIQYENFAWSRDIDDTPQLGEKLLDMGVLGSDKGIISIDIIETNGHRYSFEGKPFEGGGSKVEFWIWRKTAGFQLATDSLRNRIELAAQKHPPDSYLLPGALGPFLIQVYRGAEASQ
jgi:hypothetical protein